MPILRLDILGGQSYFVSFLASECTGGLQVQFGRIDEICCKNMTPMNRVL